MAALLRHPATPLQTGGPVLAQRTRSALPVALGLSLLTHALLAAWALGRAPEVPAATPSVARHRGAITLSLASSATKPAPSAAPLPARPRAVVRSPHKNKPALSAPLPTPTAATASAPRDSAAPQGTPGAKPGAQFASLFAPILASPLGRGGWSRPHSDQAPPPPPDPQLQRLQAAAALQASLHSRLGALLASPRAQQHALDCKIAIDTDQRVAQVDCAATADLAATWAYLNGVVTAGTVADTPSRLCFKLAEQQLASTACPDSAPTP